MNRRDTISFLLLGAFAATTAAAPANEPTIRKGLMQIAAKTNSELRGIFNQELTPTEMVVQIALGGAETAVMRKFVSPYLKRESQTAFYFNSGVPTSRQVDDLAKVSAEYSALELATISRQEAQETLTLARTAMLDELKREFATLPSSDIPSPSLQLEAVTEFNNGRPWPFRESRQKAEAFLPTSVTRQQMINATREVDLKDAAFSSAQRDLNRMRAQLVQGLYSVNRHGELVQRSSTRKALMSLASTLGRYGRGALRFASGAAGVYPFISIGSRIYVIDILGKDPGYVPVYEIATSDLVTAPAEAVAKAAVAKIESMRK